MVIKDFFNGKYGLAKTYWWGVFGVGIVTRLINQAIFRGYLTAQDDAKTAQIELFHNAFTVFLAVYMGLLLRALVKAGFADRRPGGWGWTGIILTGIGTAYAAFMAITLLFPNITTPKFLIQYELRELNRQMPQDMGDGVIMTRIAMVGNDMTYFINIDMFVGEVDKSTIENVIHIDTVDGQDICTDISGYFKGGVENVIFEYSFIDGIIRAALPAEDCLNWLRR